MSDEPWRPERKKGAPHDCGYRTECPFKCPGCPHSNYSVADAVEPDATGAPGYTFPPAGRPMFGRRRNECPKCAVRNALRQKNGLPRLPGYIYRVRVRDLALWCARCDEYFAPCSEDTVMRYDPRFHPDPDDKAA